MDILRITQPKLNNSFPESQFFIDGFSRVYRLDRTGKGGGGDLIIYS